jgi:hypothetical protein
MESTVHVSHRGASASRLLAIAALAIVLLVVVAIAVATFALPRPSAGNALVGDRSYDGVEASRLNFGSSVDRRYDAIEEIRLSQGN